MKRLILIRHSKAFDEKSGQPDFDRQLTKEGIALAEKICRKITVFILPFTKFVSSPALRAIQTARIFADIGCLKNDALVTEGFLYRYYPPENLIEYLNLLDEDNACVAVFGHNPMMSQTAEFLDNSFHGGFPKCGVAVFDFEVSSWANVKPVHARFVHFENPREYK